MLTPIKPVLELSLLMDSTATQRKAEGTERMVVLSDLHNEAVHKVVEIAMIEAIAAANDTTMKHVSGEYTGLPLTVLSALRTIEDAAQPPSRAEAQTWVMADSKIAEYEHLRARAGWLWNTATLAYQVYSNALDDVRLFIKMSSVREKEGDKANEVEMYLSDALVVLKDWDMTREYGRRVYDRIDSMIDSIHRLTQRQFQSGSYAAPGNNVDK
jgi:hypothetical protein